MCVCVFVGARFLSCQKASYDRPSSDGELTHENGHSDCKDQGENLTFLLLLLPPANQITPLWGVCGAPGVHENFLIS